MPGRRLAVGIAALVCLAWVGTSQALAAQRYVSPTGSGLACSSSSPCGIQAAFALENPGDEIIVAPGDYGPVTTTLRAYSGTYVHGTAGQPPPRIHMAFDQYVQAQATGSRISYLRIDGSGIALFEVAEGSEADQIYARSTDNDACLVYGTLIDSVCSTPGPGREALNGAASGTFTPVLRNVTAEATGSGSVGIEYHASSGGHLTISAVNVIAHGTSTDIEAAATSPDTTTINLDHSNFNSAAGSGTGAHINVTAKQSAPPHFVNAAAGDFREAPGSPTIDAGVNSPFNGSTDFEGNPRTINGVTDIGADEFDPFAGVSIGTTKAKVKKRKATVLLSCPAAAAPPACEGSLTLTFTKGGKSTTAATSAFSMPIGSSEPLRLKVSKKAVKVLAKRGKLATTATAAATDGARLARSTSAPLKLKLKRKRHR